MQSWIRIAIGAMCLTTIALAAGHAQEPAPPAA
jgi:hypothetical protein